LPDIFGSYLRYARGESKGRSAWDILRVPGALYRPLVTARNTFYDRGIFRRLEPPLPVISVGNICNGGTNKTPMVDMLARKLTEFGISVGIVSRGYSGMVKEPLWVGRGGVSSDRSVTGDEPLMLAEHLPDVKVVVSRDRYDGVRYLRELGAEAVVADDAFQHRKMGRDLDIVLVDSTCPFGNGKLFPAGILRESLESLERADMVILTKAEQAGDRLDVIKREISAWVPSEFIFTARVEIESWLELSRDGRYLYEHDEWGETPPEGKFISFSAIGNPQSFYGFLKSMGLNVVQNRAFRDHHRFTWADIDLLERMATNAGANALVCTEKDLQNMPDNSVTIFPLYIPRIRVSIDEEDRFWKSAAMMLKPRLVVASNGYGEDAIGSLLASRLKERFRCAEVSAFSLVGVGREYRNRGIDVISPDAEMPSGGIVKYSLRELLGDFRHGLRRLIKRQIEVWREYEGRFRTPICVGDVYLLTHTLWGQGLSPLLVATAKSVKLRGHWMAERLMMRLRARRVWTRDAETARDLRRVGVDAVFCGNPIMDLALESDGDDDPWSGMERPRVLLLPGSRPRAYRDAGMLMDTARLISEHMECTFLMVPAPTLDIRRMLEEIGCRLGDDGYVSAPGVEVALHTGSVASAAYGADLLIGFGGTANQVSAGLGVPVLSVVERGKAVQKKLLKDAEVLVSPDARSLADEAVKILHDPERRLEMSRAGIEIMGGAGALDAVVEFAADELGWDARCNLFEKLKGIRLTGEDEPFDEDRDGRLSEESGESGKKWQIPRHLASRVSRVMKSLKVWK
jgi:tetraacyldisaccharide 4'-kinase